MDGLTGFNETGVEIWGLFRGGTRGHLQYGCVAGVMVSIVAFQAVDPGSIPGLRTSFIAKRVPKSVTQQNRWNFYC